MFKDLTHPILDNWVKTDSKLLLHLFHGAALCLGVLVLWASAKFSVPFYPVPMTMQTFAVLLIGAAYGWKLGGLTILAYLSAGLMGLPVFAGTPEKGIGFAYMIGPTGGYLAGFLLAAFILGFLAQKGWDKTFSKALAICIFSKSIIFLAGWAWLTNYLTPQAAFSAGVAPFLLGAILKTVVASAIIPKLSKIRL